MESIRISSLPGRTTPMVRCQRKVEMSYSPQSRNVLFFGWGGEVGFKVWMILREVALLGKIQSRCDGVGSEVNGGKPSVNRALRGTLRGFCFLRRAYFGETPERRL